MPFFICFTYSETTGHKGAAKTLLYMVVNWMKCSENATKLVKCNGLSTSVNDEAAASVKVHQRLQKSQSEHAAAVQPGTEYSHHLLCTRRQIQTRCAEIKRVTAEVDV